MTECAAWKEWYRNCALDLCSAAVRRDLTSFALARFRTYLNRYEIRGNTAARGGVNVTGREAWHRFESYLLVSNTRDGKSYKDWLMARRGKSGSSERDSLEGGATLIIRNVVRDYIHGECPRVNAISLDAPFPGACDGEASFVDFLPGGIDPSDEVAMKEMEGLARRHASEILELIDRREKAALLARASSRSFGDPSIRKAAGCGKTRLKEIYDGLVAKIARKLSAEYRNEDREVLLQLHLMTFELLRSMIFLKKRAANRRSASFINTGGKPVAAGTTKRDRGEPAHEQIAEGRNSGCAGVATRAPGRLAGRMADRADFARTGN